MTGRIIIADARKVTASQFAEHFFGPYEPKRQAHIENTIRKIENGSDLYGVPPMMVEHCRKIIAERRERCEWDISDDEQSGRFAA